MAGPFVSLAACRPSPGPTVEPATPDAEQSETEIEACSVPETALAWTGEAGRCGLALIGDARPRVIELEGDGEWSVALPEPCGDDHCDYGLFETSLGPLIVASRRSPAGETPAWVGLGVELGGSFRFVDLWIGESVLDDLTPAGPVHALAPHDCEGALALLVVPRLGGAEAERPEPALVAAAGILGWDDDALVVDPVDPTRCRALEVPLP